MFRNAIILLSLLLLASCAGIETATTANTTGALVRQEASAGSNVCYYDTGLTIYTQSDCPTSVRTNGFTP